VFLAAGGSSNAPVETAARAGPGPARVVDIGKTRLDLPGTPTTRRTRRPVLPVLRPGPLRRPVRLEGVDYPAGYVRWTERRNLECFLDLLARKDLEVETLISGTFPLDDAVSVYADLSSGELKAVGVLLSYPAPDPDTQPRPATSLARPRRPGSPRYRTGRVPRAWLSASSARVTYASSMLLPHLVQLPNAELVHSRRPDPCRRVNAQRRFGFTTASTSASAVLEDESLDAISW